MNLNLSLKEYVVLKRKNQNQSHLNRAMVHFVVVIRVVVVMVGLIKIER